MATRLGAWAIAALLLSCNDSGCSSGPDGGPGTGKRPPAPAVRPGLSDAGFALDDAGRPVLARVPTMIAPGHELVISYDEKIDDPVARWGHCLQRVVACSQANQGLRIDGCIPQIERCADDSGGFGCCPPACLEAYAARRSAGDDEETALTTTFFEGSCVSGLKQQLADAADGGQEDGGSP